MTDFDAFIKEYGQPQNSEKPSQELINEYKKILPPKIIGFWERYGFAKFADGLIWVINPKQLEDVLSDWCPKKDKSRLIPVIRTSFGKIIYWNKNTFTLLDTHYNDKFDASDNVELVFNLFLIGKVARRGILQESLFKKALKKLGSLESDEMYGYKLALAMGGDYKVENMAKMKIREQLSILGQIHTN